MSIATSTSSIYHAAVHISIATSTGSIYHAAVHMSIATSTKSIYYVTAAKSCTFRDIFLEQASLALKWHVLTVSNTRVVQVKACRYAAVSIATRTACPAAFQHADT